MATELKGIMYFGDNNRDEDRHREYKIQFLVHSTTGLDGPANVIRTPGLPTVGSIWNYHADIDVGARCYPTMRVGVHMPMQGEKPRWWVVECTFGTRPIKLCSDADIDNPLLEPMKISGSFTRYSEEATEDRFGNKILTSSHEIVRGPNIEFDSNRPCVEIEQNVANLQLALCTKMIDTLNDRPLWGVVKRGVKLSDFSWERKYHGTCFPYYTRKFRFDINVKLDKESNEFKGGFDRKLLDEGSKALNGFWDGDDWVLRNINGLPPNKNNPQHFIRVKDRNGENIRVVLDGAGKPFKEGAPMISIDCEPPTCNSPTAGTAPQHWKVSGMDSEVYNIRLTYDAVQTAANPGLCIWSGQPEEASAVGPTPILLIYDPIEAKWMLENFNVGPGEALRLDRIWEIDEDEWNCGGKNVMVLQNELINNSGPSSVQVVPDGGPEPGSILVEKYGESNFLLLGIPITL